MITNIEQLYDIPQVSVLLHIMKLFNEDVHEHCISVTKITIAILDECQNQFTEQEHDEIVIGAALHDIGKILVPFNLTSSPRRFTEGEYGIMKMHTLIGTEMLKNDFSKTIQDICLYHHEQPNGTGYIIGLPLSAIPEAALIVKVADEYDALVSKRSYKSNYDKNVAISIMKNDCQTMKIDDGYFAKLKNALNNGFEV